MQILTKHVFIVAAGGALLVSIQRYEDVAVRARDRCNLAGGNTRPAARDTDVVDNRTDFSGRNRVADFALDRRESHFGFFDAGADGAAYMQFHPAGIDVRKEILADEPHEAE